MRLSFYQAKRRQKAWGCLDVQGNADCGLSTVSISGERVIGRNSSCCAWANVAVEIWDGGQVAHVQSQPMLSSQVNSFCSNYASQSACHLTFHGFTAMLVQQSTVMLWSSITGTRLGVILPKLGSSEVSSRVRRTVKVVFYMLLHEPVIAKAKGLH
jgi:hypothetical protein